MKILSVAIPCYNSQKYMRKCIDSLLPGGDEVEILIVDDGSTDETGSIAEEYAAKYPGIVKAVHQENGGHGEAVNAGLRNATGYYFKVVDSDDWVDEKHYPQVLQALRGLIGGPDVVDMVVCNYIYDKVGANRKKVMQYRHQVPVGEVFEWKDMSVRKGHYILMHSVIYRTRLLRECHLDLPKHTFYVDNLFVFQPLPSVKKMFYLDLLFYHYYIGREDQSVNEQVMIGRIDQQISVNKQMIDVMASQHGLDKQCRKYMESYLAIMMTISSMLLIRSGSEENFQKKQELWHYLKRTDRRVYYRIRSGILGMGCNLPGKSGRTVSVAAYKIAQKIYGFN